MDSVVRNSMRSVTNFVMNAPDQLMDGFQKAQDKVSGGIQKMSIRRNGRSDSVNEDGLLFDDCRVSEQITATVSCDFSIFWVTNLHMAWYA